MNKTKVALCLSGEPRSSMFCFPYIYESLINLGNEYEVDVYIHSWKNFRALPLYNPKNYSIDWINEEKYFRNILNKLLKITSNLNQDIDYIKNFSFNSGALKNTFLMYLSMQKCFELIANPYDVYIRGRFDFYFSNKIDIIPLIKNIINNENDIIIPKLEIYTQSKKHFDTFPDDQFLICNLKGAKYYFNFYNDIFDVISNSSKTNPHLFLKNYLDKSNLNINFTTMNSIDLVRSSRIITMLNLPYFDN